MKRKPKKPKEINYPDLVAKLYIQLCTPERLIFGNRLSKSYFILKSHFKNDKPEELISLANYLNELKESKLMSLSELYRNAKQYRLEVLKEHDRNINLNIVSTYDIPYAVDKFIML